MKESILKFIKKYPLTFISVIIFATLSTISMNQLSLASISNNFLSEGLAEAVLLASSLVSGSFLFSKILTVYKNRIPEKVRSNRVIESLTAIILITILHIATRCLIRFYTNWNDSFAIYTLTIIFASLTYYLIVEETGISVQEYTLKVFMNLLALSLFECIVVAGIGILFYVYYAFFGTYFGSTDWQILLNILTFQFIIVTCIGGFIAIENVKGKSSLFSKVLVKYVMMIMVLIGFIFFYAYLVKIIIKRSLPSNEVFIVCTILFSLGLSTNLMSRAFDENAPYDLIIKYLPLAFIPALILQIISLGLRINQYGFTPSRYLGVVLIIFEIIYIYLYQFKFDKFKYIFIVDTILVLIISIIPLVNMYQFPNIYNRVFNKEATTNEISLLDPTARVSNNGLVGSRTARVDYYRNVSRFDVEGFKELIDADIHIEYNEAENTWQNFNQTSKKISDFTAVNVIDVDSKVIATLDITEHLEKIEKSIIDHNYTEDSVEIMKDIPEEIVSGNLKYIITNTNVSYSEEKGRFTEVIFWGKLLTK